MGCARIPRRKKKADNGRQHFLGTLAGTVSSTVSTAKKTLNGLTGRDKGCRSRVRKEQAALGAIRNRRTKKQKVDRLPSPRSFSGQKPGKRKAC